jgi:hypothetical protein
MYSPPLLLVSYLYINQHRKGDKRKQRKMPRIPVCSCILSTCLPWSTLTVQPTTLNVLLSYINSINTWLRQLCRYFLPSIFFAVDVEIHWLRQIIRGPVISDGFSELYVIDVRQTA